MAGHFLRLKLALVAGGFRSGGQQLVGFVLGTLVVVPTALLVAFGLAALGRSGGTLAGPPLTVGFVALGVGWTVVPLLAFGIDDSLDPANLQLLPLSRRQLLLGLAVASTVGLGGAGTLLVLLGVVAGYAPAGPGAPLVVAACAGQLAVCVLAARAATTALSARLRSRRGKDLIAVLLPLIALVFAGALQLLALIPRGDDDPQAFAALFGRAGDVAGWVPFGWAARAVLAARAGAYVDAVVWLAAVAALLAALGWAWSAALQRSLTTPETSAARGRVDAGLLPGVLARLPGNRLTATLGKELRYLWRLPALRMQYAILALFGAGAVAAIVLTPALRRPEAVLLPALLAGFVSLSAVNAFGGDRGAVWLLLAAGGPVKADLVGKNLAGGLLLSLVVAASGGAVAALTGGWSLLPAALAGTAAIAGVGFGVGNVASVLAPQPLPDSPTNAFAAAAGMGFATFFVQLLAMLIQALLLIPAAAAVAAALLWRPPLFAPALVLAVAYGAAVWYGGVRLAVAQLSERGPEFLAALSRLDT